MKESETRIQFIADYISAYESKITLLNANGFFDAVKLFELFVIEVGSLYFGQRLNNLNVDTYIYPCVDLFSDDKQPDLEKLCIMTTLHHGGGSLMEKTGTNKHIALNRQAVKALKLYFSCM